MPDLIHGGFATPGSKNPRTELREMTGNSTESRDEFSEAVIYELKVSHSG